MKFFSCKSNDGDELAKNKLFLLNKLLTKSVLLKLLSN